MQWLRFRWTVFRMLLVIAIAAILLHIATDSGRRRALQRYERCMSVADWHSRIGAEYRKNARADANMLRIAAWHEHMRRSFEQAAERPWMPMPTNQRFPPESWEARGAESAPASGTPPPGG